MPFWCPAKQSANTAGSKVTASVKVNTRGRAGEQRGKQGGGCSPGGEDDCGGGVDKGARGCGVAAGARHRVVVALGAGAALRVASVLGLLALGAGGACLGARGGGEEVLLQQEGQGRGAPVSLLRGAGQKHAGRAGQAGVSRLGWAGRQAGQAGRLTAHWEQVLLLVATSAAPMKEPGRHWVQAWWEEGPTSLPWPQAAQVALTVKALRNRPLPQATQESGPAAVELAGTKPPLQGVQAAMPARGAKLLALTRAQDWHSFSSSATPLGVRVSPVQKDTLPLGHSSICVRAATPDFSL